MLEPNVVAGVHRVEDAHTNWYLVEEDDELTVVDTGLPASWRSLQGALLELGYTPDQIHAVPLTHGHFDPYTGRAGPCLVAGAATADSAMAMRSLDKLAGVDADVALTGHGGPGRGRMRDAVDHAVASGPA